VKLIPVALALLVTACAAASPETPRATAPMPEPVTLAGTGWNVPGAANPSATPRLEFSASGRVTGFTGCNMLTGSYTFDGDRLEVAAATTKRACIGAGNETEALMLAILAGRPRAAITGSKLILTTPDGKRLELDRN